MNRPANGPGGSVSANSLYQRKKMSRRWVSFLRICRYGLNNFSRNSWLSTAAVAVMTITLLIVFTTAVAKNIFGDTITALREKVDISIFLKDSVTNEQRDKLISDLRQQPLVKDVRYISKDEARNIFAQQNKQDLEKLKALSVLTGNPFPASLRIRVSDPSKLNQLDGLLNSPEFKAAQDPRRQPATSGTTREAIDRIGRVATFTERTGIILGIVAVVISMLIIFNTIRMAIFNRRDEIQMMRLIGANKSFIRGPFIVEATLYGVIAALIAAALAYPVMLLKAGSLDQYDVITGPTIEFLKNYPLLVVIGLVLMGSAIGVVSSLLAIRRHLKI